MSFSAAYKSRALIQSLTAVTTGTPASLPRTRFRDAGPSTGLSNKVLLAPLALAQENATITGSVLDPTGAVLPNVTITITNVATGQHVTQLATNGRNVTALASLNLFGRAVYAGSLCLGGNLLEEGTQKTDRIKKGRPAMQCAALLRYSSCVPGCVSSKKYLM